MFHFPLCRTTDLRNTKPMPNCKWLNKYNGPTTYMLTHYKMNNIIILQKLKRQTFHAWFNSQQQLLFSLLAYIYYSNLSSYLLNKQENQASEGTTWHIFRELFSIKHDGEFYHTTLFMQFLNSRNSFKHISRSTSGTFAATQLPYTFACKSSRNKVLKDPCVFSISQSLTKGIWKQTNMMR